MPPIQVAHAPARKRLAALLVVASIALASLPATAQEAREVSITLYPQGLAVVRANLDGDWSAGRHSIRLDDLPEGIDPSSLLLLDPRVTLHRVHGLRAWADELRAGVSLRLEIESAERVARVPIAYLTTGLGWSASYSVIVARDDSRARVDGYATVTNASAVSFHDAEVQLLAGDVEIAQGGGGVRMERALAMGEPAPAPAPSMEEATLGDVHLFTVPEPITVASGDVHRLRLLGADGLAAEREYTLTNVAFGRPRGADGSVEPIAVRYRIRRGAEGAFADAAVPAGIVRLFQADDEGRLQLLGATRIGNLPAGRDLILPIGNAFDLDALRTQIDYRRARDDAWEAEWTLRVRNSGALDREIVVQERVRGEWELLSSSHPGERRSAGLLQFRLTAPAEGEVELRFRVSVRDS